MVLFDIILVSAVMLAILCYYWKVTMSKVAVSSKNTIDLSHFLLQIKYVCRSAANSGSGFVWLLGLSMKEVYAAICEQTDMTNSSHSFSMIELIYM